MRNKTLHALNQFLIHHRMLVFLITLLLLLIIYPFIQQYFIDYLALLELFLSLILLAGIYIVSANRQLLTIAILLSMLTFSIIWFNILIKSQGLFIIGIVLEIVFFAITTAAILSHVLSYRRITADKINGAICGYLLIGINYALIYTLIENLAPGSFEFSRSLLSTLRDVRDFPAYFAHFLYYSFVTLTTLGYGDITPVQNAARVLSSLEAVLGQLYVAILIARLVGLHILHGNVVE